MRKKSLSAMLVSASVMSFCASAVAEDLNEKEIFRAAERVVAEHRVYATCLSLDSMTYKLVQDNWDMDAKMAMSWLKDQGASRIFLTQFAAAVRADKLLDGRMQISDAMKFCEKNADQVSKFHMFGFSRLAKEVEKAARTRVK